MLIPGNLTIGSMSSTVDFYREFGRGAVEIEDEISDNMLTPKFVAGQLSITEMFPENGLCLGRVFTKVSSVQGEEVISHEVSVRRQELLVAVYCMGWLYVCQVLFYVLAKISVIGPWLTGRI